MEIACQAISVFVDCGHLYLLVETGILDGNSSSQRKSLDQGNIVEGELRPADLVREIEIPVDLVAHFDRDAEKRGHGGVVGGKSVALGVITQMA